MIDMLALKSKSWIRVTEEMKEERTAYIMKILYVISRLDAAGPVNQLFDLIVGIDRSKYEIAIVTMEQEGSQSRKADFDAAGFEIFCLDVPGKLCIRKKVNELNKVIEKYQPDIIHSECLPADLVVAKCNPLGAKKVTTMHCDIYTDYLILKKGLFAFPVLPRLMLREHEKCLKKFDLLIGCSNTLRDLYAQHYEHVCAVQNGIATDRFSLTDPQGDICLNKAERKKELGLLPELPMVIVVGSLDARKNTEYIIKALGDMTVREDAPFQLVFLGIGEKMEEYRKLAEGKNIFFQGKVSNVEEYLRLADVYLSASKSEGLPLSVLEAGCCGLRMALSDIPQHREMVEKDGMKGIHFFDFTEEDALKATCATALKEEENLVQISEYFRRRFSAQRMRKEYLEKYEEIMHDK